MPLLITDHSWTESASMLSIRVPLKAVKPEKVDVVCTEEYLKVSFPPFLFEVFFFEPIDDENSTAKIGNGVALFTLPKKRHGLWEQLGVNIENDKQREIRERAVIKTQKKEMEKEEAKARRIQQERKYALETMMKIEEEERARIQKMKNDECEKAMKELEAWKEKQKAAKEEEEAEEARRRQQVAAQQEAKQIHHEKLRTPVWNPNAAEGEVSSGKKSKAANLPAPRSAGCIKVSFTPRVFPTPSRESCAPEEEEWLRKQAEAKRAVNTDLAELGDLKDNEKNPDWLKEKGDKFFIMGNYQAACNAYDLAIKLNRRIPALFSNRAACHLKLRNLHKAIEDSSQALELLTPAVSANAASRMKAHVRRGTAFCQLELYVEGLQDYQAALRIAPHSQALQADTEKIRNIIQGTELSSK